VVSYFRLLDSVSVLLYLYSFPTRRSSDLISRSFLLGKMEKGLLACSQHVDSYPSLLIVTRANNLLATLSVFLFCRSKIPVLISRSEEHTSELQSHLNLVCRLLLEKKKINYKKTQSYRCDVYLATPKRY